MAKGGAKRNPRRGSETRQRAGIIGFRATEEERAVLNGAAERVGLTLSSYVRSRTLRAPLTRAARRPTIERKLLAQLLGHLGKVGGNIHQISKHLNFGEGVVADLPDALADVRAAANAILQALGKRR